MHITYFSPFCGALSVGLPRADGRAQLRAPVRLRVREAAPSGHDPAGERGASLRVRVLVRCVTAVAVLHMCAFAVVIAGILWLRFAADTQAVRAS